MPIRYRRARPEDVSLAWHLVQPDKPLFTSKTWSQLPALWAELVERERILLCAFEDPDSQQIVSIGGFGFVNPGFLQIALAHPAKTVLEQVFAAELEGRPALLNQREVARANRRAELEILNFSAIPNFDNPNCVLEISMVVDAFQFFVRGFQLRGIWQENAVPQAAEALVTMGYQRFREVRTESGRTATLLHVSRDASLRAVGSWLGSLMVSPPPRFRFTRVEQRLLECALLDVSDRELADYFQISPDAVKKRWRSIYAKATSREPDLFQANLTGADRRRTLLQRIRQNLQEIRPYGE
jgi:hypothetical protein